MSEEKKAQNVDKDKKPASAFLMYSKEARKTVKDQNPGLGAKDVVKKIAEDWKSLPEGEKKKFTDKYEELMLEYRSNHPKVQEKKQPKVKKGSEGKQPQKKRPGK